MSPPPCSWIGPEPCPPLSQPHGAGLGLRRDPVSPLKSQVGAGSISLNPAAGPGQAPFPQQAGLGWSCPCLSLCSWLGPTVSVGSTRLGLPAGSDPQMDQALPV